MNIAILGYGIEGQEAYSYWRDGNDITVCDRNESVTLPDGVASQLGENYLDGLGQFDLIVRSPHLHPRDIVAANDETILEKVTSNTNEFMKVCPTRNIIGVTGTKGKGTTCTLITKLLEADGKTVHLGGNIGIPALELLKQNIQPTDWVVLELSSFQLIDLHTSPHIAVCLMVVSEHLDWHEDFEEYIAAKQQLFINQDENDIAIFNPHSEASVSIADGTMGQQIPYTEKPGALVANGVIQIDDQAICQTSELKLLGAHNWQNVCAALTAFWQVSQNAEAARAVFTSFSGLEHRLELVRELDGVKYYDDSFGTTPETAIVAIEAFEQPKVVILGGATKYSDFTELAKIVSTNQVRQVILIGNTSNPDHPCDSPKIAEALAAQKFTNVTSLVSDGGPTMTEIVATARAAAQPGDIVLLSAACTSFDMFQNYKDRAEQFTRAVQALV